MPTRVCVILTKDAGLWVHNVRFVVLSQDILQGQGKTQVASTGQSGENQNGRLRGFHCCSSSMKGSIPRRDCYFDLMGKSAGFGDRVGAMTCGRSHHIRRSAIEGKRRSPSMIGR